MDRTGHDTAQGLACAPAPRTHLHRVTLVRACLGQRRNEVPELVQAEGAQRFRADVAT